MVAATCDRAVFMRDGRLVDQLIKPTTESVAALLASLEARTSNLEAVAA